MSTTEKILQDLPAETIKSATIPELTTIDDWKTFVEEVDRYETLLCDPDVTLVGDEEPAPLDRPLPPLLRIDRHGSNGMHSPGKKAFF